MSTRIEVEVSDQALGRLDALAGVLGGVDSARRMILGIALQHGLAVLEAQGKGRKLVSKAGWLPKFPQPPSADPPKPTKLPKAWNQHGMGSRREAMVYLKEFPGATSAQYVAFTGKSCDKVLRTLAKVNCVEGSTITGSDGYRRKHWRLTEYGAKVLTELQKR